MIRRAAPAVLVLFAAGCAHHRAVVETSVATAAPPETRHVVERGQTLWRIAHTYGVPLDQLARANGITDPTRIEVGQVLVVPAPAIAASFERAESPWLGWPVEHGRVSSSFGSTRRGHAHQGIDIVGESGQPVLAVGRGRVTYSGASLRGYGEAVIVDHGGGLTSLYAHNSERLVGAGQLVVRGQPIARVGRSGNATTWLCHFELRRNDVPIDPLPWLGAPEEAAR